MSKITKRQLARLQVLYAQFAARSLDAGKSREARIAWASAQLGRVVTSFSDLSKDEARRLIGQLQGGLGIPPSPRRSHPRSNSRAAGTEGRRDGSSNMRTLPTQQDIDRIQDALERLGWNNSQFEAWLRSASSPLARKMGTTRVAPADITLRTLYDCNRVWWALKQMLKARGLWGN